MYSPQGLRSSTLFYVLFYCVEFGLCSGHGPHPAKEMGTKSYFIPYGNAASNPNLVEDVILNFTITTTAKRQAYSFSTPMDTGSTGVAIGAQQLGLSHEYLHRFPNGSEWLSSSNVTWEGHYINASDVNVTFTASDKSSVAAQVPILAVTRRSICGKFQNGACVPGYEQDVSYDTSNRPQYLGVGFGRWSHEQPNATADKIPLTNIAFVNGKSVDHSTLHPGYFVSSKGVEVGLTKENTANFSATRLQVMEGSPTGKDWQGVNVSIAVDGSHWNYGSALFDTGIPYSFIRLDNKTTQRLRTRTQTDSQKSYKVLTDDSKVHMLIGPVSDYIGYYNVTVGDGKNPVRPLNGVFRPEKSAPPPFINTGRYFYRRFDTVLDAECGWFGIRWRGKRNDPDGGQYAKKSWQLMLQDPDKP